MELDFQKYGSDLFEVWTENDTKAAFISELETQFTEEEISQVLPFLEAIEDMPADLLEKGTSSEINTYMAKKGISTKIYNDNIGETESDVIPGNNTGIMAVASWWRCALSIGQVIVTVGIPASQITKIKNYVAALGGVKSAAQLLVGATTASEKLYGTLTALGTVLGTLTGVTGVYDNCLS